MAVSPPVLYNGWWVYLRDIRSGHYGSTHLDPSLIQIENAYKMRTALQAQGYCAKALAGVIGAAQQESGLSPGSIEAPSLLPNGAEQIEDVPTSYMYQYYLSYTSGAGHGLGLLQWDRHSPENRNDLVQFCYNNNLVWYDGASQMYRLQREYETDDQYHFWVNNYGPNLTWSVYKNIENSQFSNYDAGECAAVWDACYERSSGTGREYKRDNANFWYQFFIDYPNPPTNFKPWMVMLLKKRKVLKRERKFF